MNFLKITKKKDYAIVQMQRGKVNALNHEMVEEIRNTFKSIDADDTIRGIILTGVPNIFSAGLDLIELYEYDETKINEFFVSFGSMYLELAHFSKPFIAALNGHSPAGGTVIAIAADYRIMAKGEKFSLGLNEVAVNIQISQNLIEGYSYWIGRGPAHRYILEGKLLRNEEALACGLVHELCPQEELMERAEKKMQHYLQADNDILINTKAKLRKSWLDNLSWDAEKDLQAAKEIWWKPEIRMKMQMYIAYLKSRSKV